MIVDYTQHSAYDPDPGKHNLYVQNMRLGIYGGVLRIDLDRIGFNDWWWLAQNMDYKSAQVLDDPERQTRIGCLLTAIEQWLLSPSFAKQAAWLQHQSGLIEGAIILSKNGPAPFFSPITLKVDMVNGQPQPRIEKNDDYRKRLDDLKTKAGDSLEVKSFNSPHELKHQTNEMLKTLFPNSSTTK